MKIFIRRLNILHIEKKQMFRKTNFEISKISQIFVLFPITSYAIVLKKLKISYFNFNCRLGITKFSYFESSNFEALPPPVN